MFENIYGLSCVENQVLAILRERGNEIAHLYHNSAIPLKELFFFIVIKGDKPEYFYRIPRIQQVLGELGVMELTFQKDKPIQAVRNKIRRCRDNEYILLRVTPEFTRTALHARGLRNDHYVRAVPCGEDFIVYNDIPDTAVSVNARTLGRIYAGDCLLLTIKKNLQEEMTEYLWKQRLYKAEKHIPFYFNENDFAGVENAATHFRDMIGVYKTMRYRLAAYYGLYLDTAFISKAMPMIERHYAMAEYLHLRGAPISKLFSLLESLNYQDEELFQLLSEKLSGKERIQS